MKSPEETRSPPGLEPGQTIAGKFRIALGAAAYMDGSVLFAESLAGGG